MFQTFSAGDTDVVEPDTSNSGTISSDSGAIIAQISIIAIITTLTIVADYQVFRDRWAAEDFFNSGTFLGKGVAEAAFVIWLITEAVKISKM